MNNRDTGWVPPSQRTPEQRRITDEFHEQIGLFRHRAPRLGAQPDRKIQHETEIAAFGSLLPRIRQLTGSCVACGAERAYCLARAGDVVARGNREDVKLSFPFIPYGIGRRAANMRGRGDGSFGSTHARAIAEYGTLPYDDPRLPQPTIRDGWAFWTERIEYDWSWPPSWPIPERELATDAATYRIESVTRLESVEDVVEALAQDRGVTIACPYIPGKPQVENDVLLDGFRGRGGHQQTITAYWKHPKHGLILANDNQWGDVHGRCPTLFPLGVTGSYWYTGTRLSRIISEGDCELYAHDTTGDFTLPEVDHRDLGIN